jgi:hypothetical protein
VLIADERGQVDAARRRAIGQRYLCPLDTRVLEDVPVAQRVDKPLGAGAVGLVRERDLQLIEVASGPISFSTGQNSMSIVLSSQSKSTGTREK